MIDVASPGEKSEIILVVDDEEEVRDLVGRALESFKLKVANFESGASTLAFLTERAKALGEARVKFIISDWVMPERFWKYARPPI